MGLLSRLREVLRFTNGLLSFSDVLPGVLTIALALLSSISKDAGLVPVLFPDVVCLSESSPSEEEGTFCDLEKINRELNNQN